jgi:hypothetical protein
VSSAPAIVITVVFERRAPIVRASWQREDDAVRMFDWLDHSPRVRKLVDDAMQLAIEDPGWEQAA